MSTPVTQESGVVVELPHKMGLRERRRAAKIISRRGGDFPARADLQDTLLFLDTGELLVDQAKRLTSEVMEYIDELRRQRAPLGQITSVDAAEIAELLKASEEAQPTSAVVVEETSARQEEALGILRDAIRRRASDIHIEVTPDGADVKYRIDGALTLARRIAKRDEAERLCRAIYAALTDVADSIFEPSQVQDARIKREFLALLELNGCRVGTMPTDRGWDMVLRLMPKAADKITLEALGFHPKQIAIFNRLTKKKTGVNVFSGPTGSGKTTALTVMMESIAENFRHELKLYSLENPPEQRMRGVSQVPVHNDGWEKRLKGILRVDPDVIMVGEMRDRSSGEIVMQAALTGHGVWTTQHANDAGAILQRFGTWGLDRDIYTDPRVVTGLINQSLVRTLCPHCKVTWAEGHHRFDREFVTRIQSRCGRTEAIRLRGPGCDECNRTGCLGRTVVCEVIAPDLAFMRIYNERGPAEARAYWRTSMGGITKLDHLVMKIVEGQVDPEVGEQTIGLLDDEETLQELAA